MGIVKALMTAVALGVLAGCASPTVRYDYDAKANYSNIKTYDWMAAPKQAAPGANPLMETRVKRAVDGELLFKGIKREATGDPDVLVSAYILYQAETSRAPRVGLGVGISPFRGLGIGVSAPIGGRRRVLVGSLVVEVHDFKSKQLIWKSVSEGALEEASSPEETDKDVAEAVRKMLSKFPPKG
jgi:hypothetical protein